MVNDKTLHIDTTVAGLSAAMSSEQIGAACVKNECWQGLAIFPKGEKPTYSVIIIVYHNQNNKTISDKMFYPLHNSYFSDMLYKNNMQQNATKSNKEER